MAVNATARRRELAAFLRSRRQAADTQAFGLDPGRRLSPGLRREEVCALAGVSLSWYTWLEQARDISPSAEVLASIARALRLDGAEQEYLLRLGGHVPRIAPGGGDPREDARLQALVDGFLPNPASVITAGFDYVAWNGASERLVPGFLGCLGHGAYNLVRFLFSADMAVPTKVAGSDPSLRSLVGQLRSNAARHPGDETIPALAEELSDTSAEFADLWRRHEVAARPRPRLPLQHPDVGLLIFDELDLSPDEHPELTLVVLLPADAQTGVRVGAMAST
jgi:transcriptional regulator with XRE-family HTH domain